MVESPAQKSVEELLRFGAQELATKEAGSSRLDARILLAAVLDRDPAHLIMHPDFLVPHESVTQFSKYLARRAKGEPVSRILGHREFWSLSFLLSPDTLDPRPDTETIIQTAISLKSDEPSNSIRVLDLGTGTGCILLSLLTEWRDAKGVGIDISVGAVETAKDNAQCLGLADRACFAVGNWSESVCGTFDVIVSNPPYVRSGDLANLQAEVREYDPLTALNGGQDGLVEYRRISEDIQRVLAPGGLVVFEVGFDQANEVRLILSEAGLRGIASHRDLNGHVRCISAGTV